MGNRPMVHLMTVTGIFHGRVVAARLGADGILTELRGDVGGTYPLGGGVHVFVEAAQAEAARHILLADEAAAALDSHPSNAPGPGHRRGNQRWRLAPAKQPRINPDPTRVPPSASRRMWPYLAWTLVAVLIALYLMAAFG